MKGLFIFDAEASGLLDEPDLHLHVILFKEYKVDNWNIFLDPNREGYDQALKFVQSKGYNFNVRTFEEFNDWVSTTPRSVACHNMFGYDLRLFKKMLGTQYDMFGDPKCMGTLNGKQVNLFDTLSMSRTLYPDRPLPRGCPEMVKNPVTGKMKPVGPHGLEAWGMRVANQKVAIEDWRGLPLWKYCDRIIEDVIINEMVWTALMEEIACDGKLVDDKRFMYKDEEKDKDAKKYKLINWKNAMRRGMLTDYLMVEQEIQGVSFDEEAALKLRDRIDQMMREIEGDVEPHLPKKEMAKSAQPTFPSKPFKGDGSLSGTGWKWLEKLGYNVNWEALDFKGPPAKSFKADGSLTAAAIKYCNEHGVEDEAAMPQFIRDQNNKQTTLIPLSPEDMARAMLDLKNQTMPDIMIPMRIGNQDDVKKFLIRDAGWKPTLWRSKDVTKDQFKKQRPDNEVDGLVREYIEQLDQVEYRDLILEYLGITLKAWQDKEKMYKLLRRKARGLPTSPQLKDMSGLCPNLEKVDGHMAKQIVKWLSLRNRRSVLDPLKEDKVDTGWLNHPRLRIDGKLPARYSGITNTGRRKHTIVANVPKPDEKVLLGKEMRGLFRASEGKYQVGIDGSNLEGMIAAWGAYEFDGGAYLRIMESGDAHSRNAEAYTKAAGKKVSRGEGKGVTYGIMYGAQAAKIASMLGISLDKAQAVIDAFWDSNIGLKGRKEALEKFWELTGKRFIYGLDGRKIYTRSKHSLLNAYQQNGGAALFDLVGILLHWQLVKRGWYDEGVRRIIYYHK
ncbi:putative DNA polymerase 1 [Cronobacter phage PBES 02]|uniref:Putative DNA polymerase 1 n=1 Tax=Cronobacter phage PBES 02 TaxID=1684115 RepID=A0A0K1YB37_9CAUD|nr:DNA polymerase [Cronobacter phage PBES 02]AKY04074.1 putative DNA polymerase 1 [Cronobacter phage PBES 02]